MIVKTETLLQIQESALQFLSASSSSSSLWANTDAAAAATTSRSNNNHVPLYQLQQLHEQERELGVTLQRVQEMANDLEARSYELRMRADSIVNLAVDRIQIHHYHQQQQQQ